MRCKGRKKNWSGKQPSSLRQHAAEKQEASSALANYFRDMLSKRVFCAARAAMARVPAAPCRAALCSISSRPPSPRADDEHSQSKQATAGNESIGYREKLTNLWKKYGVLAVGTYFGIYASTLSSVFLALDFNLVNASALGVDHTAAIQKICELVETFTGVTSLPAYIRENPRVGTFVVAWAMTKITEPARLAFTVAIVPTIARRIGRSQAAEDAADPSPSTANSSSTNSTSHTSTQHDATIVK